MAAGRCDDGTMMAYPTETVPVARSHDPLAVALGNASLLGVGYLLLRRSKLAVFATLVTVVLLAAVTRSVWFEFVVVLWWLALIAHGWFLAGGRTGRATVRKQRLIALGVTVPVLPVVGFLRFDAARIEQSVTEARAGGDCAKAMTALDNPCATAEVTDWLRQRHTSDNTLDRSTDAVARTAPAALVGCGDDLMNSQDWEKARTRYRQLLDQYPGQQLTSKAQAGVKQATLSLELANVRNLLSGSTSTQPAYCATPAQYSGAPPYGKGTNRALFYGNDDYTGKVPAEWRVTDATNAVLVVCASQEDYGTPVQTCP